jgi:hypothetical protein
LAWYPLVSVAIISWLHEEPLITPTYSSELWALWDKWWFALFLATVLAVTMFFSMHAWRRRTALGWPRVLWLAGFWLLGPIVLPAYWWAETVSDRADR